MTDNTEITDGFSLTLIFHLKLLELPDNRERGYIFTYAENGFSLTSFIKEESIFFGLSDSSDLLEIPAKDIINEITMISFEFYCHKQNIEFEVYFGEDRQGSNTSSISTSSHTEHIFQSIGGSINNDNFGFFHLYEMMAYSRILTQPDLSQLYTYLSRKPSTHYMAFNGNQFMYRDIGTGSL